MDVSIAEIADAIGAVVAGDGAFRVGRAAEPSAAGPGDLALAMDESYGAALARGGARAAVLWEGADWRALGLEAAIFVSRPRHALAGITHAFERPPELAPGIHPSAVIDPTAEIGEGVAIGAHCVIGRGARLGEGARLMPHVTIAEDAEIGPGACLYSGVRIGSRVRIGARFIAHFNAVVGGDGFSFVTAEESAVERARRSLGAEGADGTAGTGADAQPYLRIASNGAVTIGDDVELGACATIDKGTIADTAVGARSKIDNHVQIGHNVRVGSDCLLCAHAAIAGSSRLGDRVVLGGQSGVGDHLEIGDDVIAAGATAILSNVPKGRVMMGYPAMPMQRNIDAYKALRRLPRLLARLEALEARLARIEGRDPEAEQT